MELKLKLKPLDLGLKDEFLIHLVFTSLPKEYETFVVNYNMQPDKWDIEKLITMCAQEEERLKSSQGDSANLVKDNKKKNFNKNVKPQGKAPQNDHHQKNNNAQVEKDQCKWCKKHGHYQRDCRVHKPGVPHGPASQQGLGPTNNVASNT